MKRPAGDHQELEPSRIPVSCRSAQRSRWPLPLIAALDGAPGLCQACGDISYRRPARRLATTLPRERVVFRTRYESAQPFSLCAHQPDFAVANKASARFEGNQSAVRGEAQGLASSRSLRGGPPRTETTQPVGGLSGAAYEGGGNKLGAVREPPIRPPTTGVRRPPLRLRNVEIPGLNQLQVRSHGSLYATYFPSGDTAPSIYRVFAWICGESCAPSVGARVERPDKAAGAEARTLRARSPTTANSAPCHGRRATAVGAGL